MKPKLGILAALMPSVVMATALVTGTALVSNSAGAGTITVNNPSFETLPAGYNLFNFPYFANVATDPNYNIPGWTATTNAGALGYAAGQQWPGCCSYISPPPVGPDIAFLSEGKISQTVGQTAVQGVTYTLQVDVGFRTDLTNDGTVALVVGSNTIYATGTSNQHSGNWYNWTAIYTATAADAGQSISIVLSNPTIGGDQGDYDNVRLTDNATPLPAALPLFATGLGVMGLLGWRRNRKAQATA
jgi:hypothetical protein